MIACSKVSFFSQSKYTHAGFQIRVRTGKSFYFSSKTYVLGTQKNRLNETVLLSTQNTHLNSRVIHYCILGAITVLCTCVLWVLKTKSQWDGSFEYQKHIWLNRWESKWEQFYAQIFLFNWTYGVLTSKSFYLNHYFLPSKWAVVKLLQNFKPFLKTVMIQSSHTSVSYHITIFQLVSPLCALLFQDYIPSLKTE